MWNNYLFLGICFFFCLVPVQARQVIAKARTAYQAFHSMDVDANVYVENEGNILFDEDSRDLWVAGQFTDFSRRSSVDSSVRVRLFVDSNYPAFPENWIEVFTKELSEESSKNLQGGANHFDKTHYIRIPGSVFPPAKALIRAKMDIILQTKVKFGWAARESRKSTVFYLSDYPRFMNRRIQTAAVQKLNTWAHARYQMLVRSEQVLSRLMDPAFKIGVETPLEVMKEYLAYFRKYVDKYYDEMDFKAYMTEFITAFSHGIDEKILFPVELTTFLNVEDKDFNFKTLMPEVQNRMLGYKNQVQNHRNFLALLRLIGLELSLDSKYGQMIDLSRQELERLSLFQEFKTRNGYIDQLNLLKKTAKSQELSYDAIGVDLKRTLGWNLREKTWSPLERSPVFALANSDVFKSVEVERDVVEAVRGFYYALFFFLGTEKYYAKILQEVVNTALSVFQLSPPEITFRLDNEILFNGEEGILIARVYNPSRYLSLENIHLLMEKNNLRRIIFYRGDNLQTIERLKPQEVKFVFIRFSCIGIGTDYPGMKVRYNKDFETDVRVIPIAVGRKDEFLSQAMERIDSTVEKDVYNSYSRLKDRLQEFRDKLKKQTRQDQIHADEQSKKSKKSLSPMMKDLGE